MLWRNTSWSCVSRLGGCALLFLILMKKTTTYALVRIPSKVLLQWTVRQSAKEKPATPLRQCAGTSAKKTFPGYRKLKLLWVLSSFLANFLCIVLKLAIPSLLSASPQMHNSSIFLWQLSLFFFLFFKHFSSLHLFGSLNRKRERWNG